MLVKTDNQKYVQRGADIIIQYDSQWGEEVKEANYNKVGAPYQFADSFFMMAAAFRAANRSPYRQLSGMVNKMTNSQYAPDYTTIFRRTNRIKVTENENMIIARNPGTKKMPASVFVMDSTGLKQHNRGEWIRQKWKIRRGFVKVHLLIDQTTLKILAVMVTDDSVADVNMLSSLLGQVAPGPKCKPCGQRNMLAEGVAPLANCQPKTVAEDPTNSTTANVVAPLTNSQPETDETYLLADKAYSSRKNVQECVDRGIIPLIPHKKNSTTQGKGSGDAWGDTVRHQYGGSPRHDIGQLTDDEKLENMRYWKSTVGYGGRWTVEIVISAFKRLFGEDLRALKWKNMVQEVAFRVHLYNDWVDRGLERSI